jgi:uncharacterized protein (DUF2141 family)
MPRHKSLLCLFAAASLAKAFQSPAPQPAKGSIEGQVVNARTSTPLKRATVRLASIPSNPGGGGGRGPAERPILINKETDEQGRFVIPNLDPGRYRITAERQGFLRQAWGARKYSGGNTPVMVGDGQAVKAIDFRLMPQGVITGKVLDEDGEPMANVQVRAQRAYNFNGRKGWNTMATATTSDIGEYRLPELKPGSYVVAATPRNNQMNAMASRDPNDALPAGPELTYASTYYPSTADGTAAIPVDVTEGAELRGIDVRLVKTRVFRVRGTITGLPSAGESGGRRGPMVPVSLTPREGTPSATQPMMAQVRIPDGSFEIRNVPPGQYLAHAQTQMGGQQYMAVAPVDVIGNHVEGVVLNMAGGRDVQGSIKVVDAAAPAELPNVQVALRPVGFNGATPRARASDLKFTLKGVNSIRYTVNVSGFPDTYYVKSIQYGGADMPEDGADLSTGGVIEVLLSAAAGQMDLVVVTGDNKAAAGAQVVVVKDGATSSVRTADENGILSIRGLKPGSYRVLAWEDVDPDQLWDSGYLRKFENEGKSVKVDNGSHEAVQLKALPAQ